MSLVDQLGTRAVAFALAATMSATASLSLSTTAAAALAPGQVLVADARAYGGCTAGCGGLMTADPVTGAESVLSSNGQQVNTSSQMFDVPFTLALDSAGEVLVANTFGMGGTCNYGCGGVIKVDPASGKEALVSSNAMPVNASSQYFYQPTGIAVDAAGDIIVADWGKCLGCGKVIKVDPNTGKETLISSNTMPVNASSQMFAYIQGLGIDHAGNILVANALGEGGDGGIVKVDPSTGKESELSGSDMPINAASQYFHAPVNLTVDASGDVLVADWGHCSGGCGGVIKVDPNTGKETLLSANSLPVNASSQYFTSPTGIALDASGDIIVADEDAFGGACSGGCGGLIEVNPTTGKETKLAANDMPVNGSNQLFVDPFAVLVMPPASGGSPPPPPGGSPRPALFEARIVKAGIDRSHGRARFSFRAAHGRGRVAFICRLDHRNWRRCTSPTTYRHLRAGHHEFQVEAVELPSRARSIHASYRFTIVRR